MKTAMTELFEQLERMGHSSAFIFWLKLHKDKLLEQEREQVLDAFVSGDLRGSGEIPFNAEQYFTQSFKK